jgi:triosephosphate isomerase
LNKVLFAYEPVWSIGTGIVPKASDLKKNVNFIRNNLFKKFRLKNPKILYGGSVNPKNVKNLKEINVIDGFLIGAASQDPKKFIDIVKKTFN